MMGYMKSEKTNSKKAIFERNYRFLFSITIITVMLYVFIKYPIELGDEIENVVNNLIVFVSIIIGFLGVLLGVLLSLRHEKIVLALFEMEAKETLKYYFIMPLVSGTGSVLFGCTIFFRDAIDAFIQNVYGYLVVSECIIIIWMFFTLYMLFSTCRLVSIMFELVFSDGKIQERERVVEDKKRTKELENKYSE